MLATLVAHGGEGRAALLPHAARCVELLPDHQVLVAGPREVVIWRLAPKPTVVSRFRPTAGIWPNDDARYGRPMRMAGGKDRRELYVPLGDGSIQRLPLDLKAEAAARAPRPLTPWEREQYISEPTAAARKP